MANDDLSPAAKKLVELCGHEGRVSEALKTNPDLVAGLDEYLEWRDRENMNISEQGKVPAIGHSMKDVIKSLRLFGKNKKTKK